MTELEDLEARARAWLAEDPDETTRAELARVLDGLPGTAADLADRFAGPLTFGTAGLRGPLRAGPNGMNLAVVTQAAAGLVGWLAASGASGPLVIGYDARHGSREFAERTARVATGAGREAQTHVRAAAGTADPADERLPVRAGDDQFAVVPDEVHAAVGQDRRTGRT